MADFPSQRVAKKGRRANFSPTGDIDETLPDQDLNIEPKSYNDSERPALTKKGGWANDSPKEKRKGTNKKKSPDTEVSAIDDERLHTNHEISQDNDKDIPLIPDLDDFQEEDLANKIAAPPSIQVNRVATYKELDNDFQKSSYLLTLDNEIDLKLLGKVLAPESAVLEEDKNWDWDRLFTEVSSELLTEWERHNNGDDSTSQQNSE